MSGLDIPLPGAPEDYDNGRTYEFPSDSGAVGQVMTSNGPGVDPTWQAAGGGAVARIAAGEDANGIDTVGTTMSYLTTTVDMSDLQQGDIVRFELSLNMWPARGITVNLQDGLGSNQDVITNFVPLDTAYAQHCFITFDLVVNRGLNGALFMTAKSVNSGNGISTDGRTGFGHNLSATNFQISFVTAGTWNGGDGFTYANYFQVYTIKG